MVAAGVPDVVERVVEVCRCPALAPPVPGRGVVAAGQAHREREEVRPLEGETGRVESAEAAAERHDVDRTVAVVVDPRQDIAEYPRLVPLMPARPLLERDLLVGPGGRVVAVDAVDLEPSRVEQTLHGADHAVVLEVPCPA